MRLTPDEEINFENCWKDFISNKITQKNSTLKFFCYEFFLYGQSYYEGSMAADTKIRREAFEKIREKFDSKSAFVTDYYDLARNFYALGSSAAPWRKHHDKRVSTK